MERENPEVSPSPLLTIAKAVNTDDRPAPVHHFQISVALCIGVQWIGGSTSGPGVGPPGRVQVMLEKRMSEGFSNRD